MAFYSCLSTPSRTLVNPCPLNLADQVLQKIFRDDHSGVVNLTFEVVGRLSTVIGSRSCYPGSWNPYLVQ